MDITEYCALILILKTTLDLAEDIIKWPQSLRGSANENRRHYLKEKAHNRCCLQDGELYIKVPFNKQRQPTGPTGKSV